MLAAVVTCGAGSSFGQAQVPETQPGVVVVTPTRDERMLADVPASVSRSAGRPATRSTT